MRIRVLNWVVLAGFLGPSLLPSQATQVQSPAIDFSGVLFLNYQMRTDSAAKFTTGGKPTSRFDVERAYLIFRMPAGNRASIRVTTDIFQNVAGGYYTGWTARLKHAYLQYEFSRNFAGVQGLNAVGRFGMLHTVVVDHIETFWPRYLGITAVERAGFFASADVGAVTLLTLPGRRGEAYVTITNGPGYTSAETDRFKDVAARFSFTPFGRDSGMLRTFTITPWYYKGNSASAFTAPPNAISDGLQKDRRGIFVGLRDRRLTVGADFDQRIEEVEAGAPPARTVSSRTSNLVSGFALVRPAELMDAKKRSNLGLVGRYDSFKLDKSAPASATNTAYTFTVLGAFWDVTPRTTLALDYQELARKSGATSILPTKTFFLHWQVLF
jgi:hypothetical protein